MTWIKQIKLLMKSRCSSAPRMERVFTPRVKDGRLSNENPQVHYYNKTATRFTNRANPNYHHNPESSPTKEKIHYQAPEHQVQQIIDQKLTVAQIPEYKDQNKKGGQITKGRKNEQKTIYGRNLQFPAPQKGVAFNNFNDRRPQTAQIKRSNSMYSSMHFVDRSTKSSAIKEKKQQFDQKFKAAFGYLLDNNEAYLRECRRACNQKARPKDEIFKIKRPNITTTNKDEYGQKDTPYAQHMDPRAQTVANSFGPRKVCGNSTSNEFHCGRNGPKADLAQWPDHYKLQGPLYGVTQYANNFPHPGNYEKMVPIATFNEHPLGMPHRTNSTSRTFHKGQFTKRADLATWNNMHPYGNEFNPDRGTTYGTKHNFKDQQPIQQWPMYDPQLIKSDGKFTTQYGSKLVDPTTHELNEANYCHCGRKPCQH